MTENEMVGWHYQLNGHEFESALGVGDGQGSWHGAVHGVTESDTTATELNYTEWCNSIAVATTPASSIKSKTTIIITTHVHIHIDIIFLVCHSLVFLNIFIWTIFLKSLLNLL